jgi:hypothetical protein
MCGDTLIDIGGEPYVADLLPADGSSRWSARTWQALAS